MVTLDAESYVALVLFLITTYLTLRPWQITTIQVPFKCTSPFLPRKIPLTLSLASAPPIACAILWASGIISSDRVRFGIVGSPDGVQPVSALLLVLSLAYICVSLDGTLLLKALSWKVARWGAKNGEIGLKLYLALSCLSAILTIFVSNDVVVLTLTPIIANLVKTLQLETSPWLLGPGFFILNVASAALYTGNPANVLAAQARSLNFPSYAAVALLPTLVAVLGLILCLCLAYWTRLKSKAANPHDLIQSLFQSEGVPVEKNAALFTGSCLILSLVALSLGSVFAHRIYIWVWTGPFAILAVIRDLVADRMANRDKTPEQDTSPPQEMTETDNPRIEDNSLVSIKGRGTEMATTESPQPMQSTSSSASSISSLRSSQNSKISIECEYESHPSPSSEPTQRHAFRDAFLRTPWKLCPYLLGMFVLVEALDGTGWTHLLSVALTSMSPNGPAAVFSVGVVTMLFCPIFNNLPATALVIRALQQEPFSQLGDRQVAGGLFGTVLGANFGGNLGPTGSLASVLFGDVLQAADMSVNPWVFFGSGLGFMIVSLGLGGGILSLEISAGWG